MNRPTEHAQQEPPGVSRLGAIAGGDAGACNEEVGQFILTVKELRTLTGRIQSNSQARELDSMCIPYSRRRNGSLVVMRIAVESLLGNCNAKIQANEPRLHLI